MYLRVVGSTYNEWTRQPHGKTKIREVHIYADILYVCADNVRRKNSTERSVVTKSVRLYRVLYLAEVCM